MHACIGGDDDGDVDNDDSRPALPCHAMSPCHVGWPVLLFCGEGPPTFSAPLTMWVALLLFVRLIFPLFVRCWFGCLQKNKLLALALRR